MDISQEYRCGECPIISMPRPNVPAGGVNPSPRHLQPLIYCIRSPRDMCIPGTEGIQKQKRLESTRREFRLPSYPDIMRGNVK